MIGGASIRGVVGSIAWSYYVCARIEGYRVRRAKDGTWSLAATVIPGTADAYKLKQSPLMFVAPHEKGEWRWPIREFTLQAGSLTAQLGPPME